VPDSFVVRWPNLYLRLPTLWNLWLLLVCDPKAVPMSHSKLVKSVRSEYGVAGFSFSCIEYKAS